LLATLNYLTIYVNSSLRVEYGDLDGDFAAMEELLKPRVEEAKKTPKGFQALGVIDYWTPQPVFEQLMEMTKKMGKF